MESNKDILKGFGSRRRIDLFTPDGFSQSIIVVSTTINREATETATTKVIAINYFYAMNQLGKNCNWKILNNSDNIEDGLKFHDSYLKKLKNEVFE